MQFNSVRPSSQQQRCRCRGRAFTEGRGFCHEQRTFYGREAIEKFRVGLFKEWHFSHHLIKTDPSSPRVRHVEVSLGTPREVNPVFCGREEGAKARMVINNTRPE